MQSNMLAPGGNAKSSRFSTLKVFGKFGGGGKGVKGGKDDSGPPPLPPKDPYYLSNRSFTSLSPESNPASPRTPPTVPPVPTTSQTGPADQTTLKAQYARRQAPGSIHPGSSSMSLASLASTSAGSPSDGMLSPPLSSRGVQNKKSGFFKFGRGSKSPSIRSGSVSGEDKPEGAEDENISLPWNFSHNIHVDEGYSGMPPSWTVSLAEAGFTEEEIAAIYARKQSGTLTPGSGFKSSNTGFSSPSLQYLYERPRSPATSIGSASYTTHTSNTNSTNPHGQLQPQPQPIRSNTSPAIGATTTRGVLANPLPRSTSLPRQYSDASLRSTSTNSQATPPLPYSTPNSLLGRKIQPSTSAPSAPTNTRSRANSSSSASSPTNTHTRGVSVLSISVEGADPRMRPNVVLEQGDGDGEESYQQETDAVIMTKQDKKRSPSSTQPPVNLSDGSHQLRQQTPQQQQQRARTRTYYVINDDQLNDGEDVDATPRADSKRNSRRRSKRMFPPAVVGAGIGTGQHSRTPSLSQQQHSHSRTPSYSQHSRAPSSSASPTKVNRENTHTRNESAASARTAASGSSASGSSSSHHQSQPRKIELPLPDIGSGLGLGTLDLGFDLGFSLDLDGRKVEEDAGQTLPVTPLTSRSTATSSPGFLDAGSAYSSGSSPIYSLHSQTQSRSRTSPSASPTYSLPNTHPSVVIDDTTSSYTPPQSSTSLTFSPSTSSSSGHLLVSAPFLNSNTPLMTGPPASPTSPFPRSPSPTSPYPLPASHPHTNSSASSTYPSSLIAPFTGTALSPIPSTAETEGTEMSPSPHAGLFNEIRGMLAPGGMGMGGQSTQNRQNAQNGKSKKRRKVKKDKERTPIERLRGYDHDEEDEEQDDDEEDGEEYDDEEGDERGEGQDAEIGWNSPAISESHSPTLPPMSPNPPQPPRSKPYGNRVSAYRIQDREQMHKVGQGQGHRASGSGSGPEDEGYGFLTADAAEGRNGAMNRNSSRSSSSTLSTVSRLSAMTVTATSAVVRRAVAMEVGAPSAGAGTKIDVPRASSPALAPTPLVPQTSSRSASPVPSISRSSPRPVNVPSRTASPALRPSLPPPARPPPPVPVHNSALAPAPVPSSPAASSPVVRARSPATSLKSQKSAKPSSPQSSTFGESGGSEEGEEYSSASASTSASISINSVSASSRTSGTSISTRASPITEQHEQIDEEETELVYYLDSPLPTQTMFDQKMQVQVQPKQTVLHEHHHLLTSASDTFGGAYTKSDVRPPYEYDESDFEEEEENGIKPGVTYDDVLDAYGETDDPDGDLDNEEQSTLGPGSTLPNLPPMPPVPVRPTIDINSATRSPGPFTAAMTNTPATPAPRYRGWLSELVRPLEEFIDEPIDPRSYYLDLQEVAEGESGSVHAARVSGTANLNKLRLSPMLKAQDAKNQAEGATALVAIKCIAITPGTAGAGTGKLEEVRRELVLLKGLVHGNVLAMDALYVDLVEDALWIRMELMERSLADVVALCEEGLVLQERVIARFTNDMLEALQFLRSHDIAHRDVRSDSLLLNSQGVLKLADFSNAVKVSAASPLASDPVGVLYWQAPEVRSARYNALKIDVWSVGATVWELAQAEPPFADTGIPAERWPKLRKPEIYSPAFHDFLRLCSEPAATRPDAQELLKNSFVNNTCGRPVIGQLLQQCLAIEKVIAQREEQEELES